VGISERKTKKEIKEENAKGNEEGKTATEKDGHIGGLILGGRPAGSCAAPISRRLPRGASTTLGARSGQLTKMIHDAIEHSDMQLIAETYNILSNVFRSAPDAAAVFGRWIGAASLVLDRYHREAAHEEGRGSAPCRSDPRWRRSGGHRQVGRTGLIRSDGRDAGIR
jgi:hypothetical protein